MIVDVVKPNDSTNTAYPKSDSPTAWRFLPEPIITMPAMEATKLRAAMPR